MDFFHGLASRGGIRADATEPRRLEDMLAHGRKLESLGQLAAGIVHEINSPMQYVSDNLEFLDENVASIAKLMHKLETLLADPAAGETPVSALRADLEACRGFAEFPSAVADCREGVGRIIQTVRAMKQFSHPGTCSKVPADINQVIESVFTVSRNSWKYLAAAELQLDPELPAVSCQPTELSQVLLNLILNAVDAIAEKKERDPQYADHRIIARSRRVGDSVEISVEDSGCGMPPEVLDRIYEPFFTTKGVGKGTGLGLPLSYDVIVKRHGGTIDVSSDPGKGTCFRIMLPIAPPTETEPFPSPRKNRRAQPLTRAG